MTPWQDAEVPSWVTPEIASDQTIISTLWLQRARDTQDPWAAFLYNYIAFNALYSLFDSIDQRDRSTPRSEMSCIQRAIRVIPAQQLIAVRESGSGLEAYMAGRPELRDMRPRSRFPVRQPRDQTPSRHHTEENLTMSPILTAVGRVYRIRCNLAHGGKRPLGEDETLVKLATPVLRCLTMGVRAGLPMLDYLAPPDTA
jgi:hypothetical protein